MAYNKEFIDFLEIVYGVLPVSLRDNNKRDIMGFCNNKNL